MTDTMTINFVEAPARQLTKISVDLIKSVPAPTSKPRQQSLIEIGQVDPVRVRLTSEGLYSITDGRRRVANLIANGATEIEVIIEDINDNQAAFTALALNVSRSHSPMTEARLIAQLMQTHTQQEVAKMLGVTQALISQRLTLLDLVPELQDKLERGEMTMSAARAAIKLPTSDQLALSRLDKITVDAARQVLRSYQAEMVDLSAIDIPEMETEPASVQVTKEQAKALAKGQPLNILVNGQEVIITVL
jgi:ParB/RepB/Spo0J family partition protein